MTNSKSKLDNHEEGPITVSIARKIKKGFEKEYEHWEKSVITEASKFPGYMGTNFLAIGLGGALSGVMYTSIYGMFNDMNHPEYVWFTLGAHMTLGIIAMLIFTHTAGEFKELDA